MANPPQAEVPLAQMTPAALNQRIAKLESEAQHSPNSDRVNADLFAANREATVRGLLRERDALVKRVATLSGADRLSELAQFSARLPSLTTHGLWYSGITLANDGALVQWNQNPNTIRQAKREQRLTVHPDGIVRYKNQVLNVLHDDLRLWYTQ